MRLYLLFICLFLFSFSLSGQVVTKPNQVGINTETPANNVSLHIKDNFEAIRLDGNAPFISFYDGPTYRAYLYMTGNNLALINQRPGNIYLGTQGTTDFSINSTGSVGIGTTLPLSRLHVAQGILAGGTFNANTIGGFMKSNGNGYLSVVTDDIYESGLLFGDDLSAQQGGIIYNNGSTPDGLQFRVNGNLTRMALDSQGDLGIGKSNPARPIHVKSRNGGDEYGILVERSGSSVTWEVSVFSGRWNWFYNGATTPVAAILTDGTYTTSDRRLKNNIRPYKEVLPLLDQLHVSTYRMKNSSEKNKTSLGLIAQDVVKVFPEIVNYGPDRAGEMYYSMDYSKVGVIALKAIQELQRELKTKADATELLESKVEDLETANARLQSENAQLQERLAAVESAIARFETNCCNSPQRIPLELPDGARKDRVRLDQNQPNPFSTSTRIQFFIPRTVEQATLQVTGPEGTVIRQLQLDQRGEGELILETQSLPSGVYYYSLLIDGRIQKTRRMVLN